MADERRVNSRRKFGYYMRVMDNSTNELLGYMADISPRGFKLDSSKPLIINKDYTMRLDLTPDISERSFILFVGRIKWVQKDSTDPNSTYEGIQVINISPHDEIIFNRILDKYGKNDRR
jgi:hypothetical protein